MKRYLDLAVIALVLAACSLWPLLGCGDSPSLTGSATYTNAQGVRFNAGGTVLATAGQVLQPLAPMQIRFCNQSSKVSAAAWQGHLEAINWALSTDFNRRWSCGASLVNYVGPIDPGVPTIVLLDSDDESQPGATELYPGNGNVWRVLVLQRTLQAIRSYLCHACWNVAEPYWLPGQSVEAFGYARPNYDGGPDELSDFDTPAHHGLSGGVSTDYLDRPAYDLLHMLAYP